jgi:hypothetical protein
LNGLIPIPLPGAYLVLTLLFVNLLLGGIIRVRKSWRKPGMMIAHMGILLMLAAGFVTFKFSTNGSMALYEGQISDTVESYYDWAVEIEETGENSSGERLIISWEDLRDLKPGDSRTFFSEDLPFDLTLSGFALNSRPVRAAGNPHVKAVDGFFLQTLEPAMEAERNVVGAYVMILDKQTGAANEGILWGLSLHPYSVNSGGRDWAIKMRRARWKVPLSILLDKFTMERHPGTDIPKVFRSDITKIEGDSHEKIQITMNEPLRYKGYTFFQSSWGPQDAKPGEKLYSGFAVVRNPADQWPLYSCVMVGVGLLIHFGQKLLAFISAQNKGRPRR